VLLHFLDVDDVEVELLALEQIRIYLFIHVDGQETSHQLAPQVYPGVDQQEHLHGGEHDEQDVDGRPEGELFCLHILFEWAVELKLVYAVEAFAAA
jgi:hypothetical protein